MDSDVPEIVKSVFNSESSWREEGDEELSVCKNGMSRCSYLLEHPTFPMWDLRDVHSGMDLVWLGNPNGFLNNFIYLFFFFRRNIEHYLFPKEEIFLLKVSNRGAEITSRPCDMRAARCRFLGKCIWGAQITKDELQSLKWGKVQMAFSAIPPVKAETWLADGGWPKAKCFSDQEDWEALSGSQTLSDEGRMEEGLLWNYVQ